MIERPDPVNWSTLKHIGQSPKHYRHALAHPRQDTESLLLGRVTHCAIYEPGELASRYTIAPRFHRGQNDDTAVRNGYDGGKQAAAEWDAENADKEVVAPELWERATGMAAAIHADPVAGPMVVGGFAEQLITWTDGAIECRGRVDHVNGRLSDLKTSRSIEPRWFAAQAARLQYHGQIAYYSMGLEANGVTLDEPPAFIVVENEAPYDVAVMQLAPQELRAGRDLCRRYLDLLARCREADHWPGVAGGEIVPLGLPAWAVPDDEEPITMGGLPIM